MRQRLQGGRFRWLNEKLYTCKGGEALSLPPIRKEDAAHKAQAAGASEPRTSAAPPPEHVRDPEPG